MGRVKKPKVCCNFCNSTNSFLYHSSVSVWGKCSCDWDARRFNTLHHAGFGGDRKYRQSSASLNSRSEDAGLCLTSAGLSPRTSASARGRQSLFEDAGLCLRTPVFVRQALVLVRGHWSVSADACLYLSTPVLVWGNSEKSLCYCSMDTCTLLHVHNTLIWVNTWNCTSNLWQSTLRAGTCTFAAVCLLLPPLRVNTQSSTELIETEARRQKWLTRFLFARPMSVHKPNTEVSIQFYSRGRSNTLKLRGHQTGRNQQTSSHLYKSTGFTWLIQFLTTAHVAEKSVFFTSLRVNVNSVLHTLLISDMLMSWVTFNWD